MSRPMDAASLADGLLAGDRRALARALTQVENETPTGYEILSRLYPHTGRAQVIGITGAPGTGKSSFVNALTHHLRRLGQKVGVVAVDPSSPFSQGAILGDRIRMQDHSGDVGVFIRSMASRGSLGGLARASVDMVRVLDAAGFDTVLIETVGAGQNEVAIAGAAQTVIVMEAPGLGDDIQANKAGILEIADILVVNKADNPAADKTVHVLKAMLDLGHRMQMVAHHGEMLMQRDGGPEPEIDTWQVPVIKTISIQGVGLEAVYTAIQGHQQHLAASGLGAEREAARLEAELAARLQAKLLEHFLAQTPQEKLGQVLSQMQARQLSPAAAVGALLQF
jgi:LAO/AO transport system kinase